MSIIMAIMMLVADQMMYDQHNTKRDRIYGCFRRSNDNGQALGGIDNATSPMPLRDELSENYTGIEKVVRFKRGFGNSWLEFEDKDVNIPLSGFFADPEALDVFEYELEYGDPATALVKPFSVVLTKQAARKLFKVENPLGLTVTVGADRVYTVTGVLKRHRKNRTSFLKPWPVCLPLEVSRPAANLGAISKIGRTFGTVGITLF